MRRWAGPRWWGGTPPPFRSAVKFSDHVSRRGSWRCGTPAGVFRASASPSSRGRADQRPRRLRPRRHGGRRPRTRQRNPPAHRPKLQRARCHQRAADRFTTPASAGRGAGTTAYADRRWWSPLRARTAFGGATADGRLATRHGAGRATGDGGAVRRRVYERMTAAWPSVPAHRPASSIDLRLRLLTRRYSLAAGPADAWRWWRVFELPDVQRCRGRFRLHAQRIDRSAAGGFSGV